MGRAIAPGHLPHPARQGIPALEPRLADIYWWTATEADPEHVYRVAYNGYVLVVPKKMSMGSCAFRAVRRVPPNRGEKGQ